MFYRCCGSEGESCRKRVLFIQGVLNKEKLKNDLRESSYLFNCFDFDKMFESKWWCTSCYEKFREEVFEKAQQVQLHYQEVKLIENPFEGSYILEVGAEIEPFEVETTMDNRELTLSHVKFYACWNGHSAVVNLVDTSVEDGLILSGSFVHLEKADKSSRDVSKWLQELEGLEKLANLLSQQLITKEEFESQKQKVIK